MARTRAPSPRREDKQPGNGSLLALFLYFGVLALLLLVFVAISFVACSASVPIRVGFSPPR
jgi:hypothetical protein